MKYLFIISLSLLLTACPDEKEVKESIDYLKKSRIESEKLITKGDFSTEKLLIIQEYFFNISEKLQLLKDDPAGLSRFQTYVKQQSVETFCSNFFINAEKYQELVGFCESSGTFSCSYEMRFYPQTIESIKKILETTLKIKLSKKSRCSVKY